jgi:MSHA biogenesis protein MshM
MVTVVLVLGLVLGYLASTWYQGYRTTMTTPAVVGENLEIIDKADDIKVISEADSTPVAIAGNEVAELAPTDIIQEDILSRRINATSVWLAGEPTSTVSIQLMGGREGPQLRSDLEVLSQKIEVDNIFVYRTQVDGLPFLNVLYGSFKDRTAAMEALQNLPADLRKNKPQLRTIAGVLQETKQLP